MELLDRVKSSQDLTVKYIFKLEDGLIMETTYIDNLTGKDIICVSCQTMCAMGCTFCHLTDYIGILKLRNITSEEIVESVDFVCNDLNLKDKNRTLLISYMGSGEPFLNLNFVMDSIIDLMGQYEHIRFGLATSLPKGQWEGVFKLAKVVKDHEIPLKLHLSLHYTNDIDRNKMMPNALDIKASIAALEFYKQITGNAVEIHYTMIKDVNDGKNDAYTLSDLLKYRGIPVKFLRFNSKESNVNEGAEKKTIYSFREFLFGSGIETEYYEPPGKDVGASCGQFLFDQYEIHNLKK
jgi:23S rRNA (adenine2503-C2)-methyltransferase